MRTNPLKTYLIEDELNSRLMLRELLESNFKDIEICGEADNLDKAKEDLMSQEFDLLFCDIKVRGKSSIDLLESLDEMNFQTIFTTAFSDFAINAIRLNAVDYLLKPISVDHLEKAVQRARQAIETPEQLPAQNIRGLNKLMISETGGLYFIELEDILYLKADKTYTEIYTIDGNKHISCKGLAHFESLLSKNLFYRIHHSYIVNLIHVKSFNARNLEIELSHKIRLNVSNRKKAEFIRNLESLSFA
ncbi:MAG: response regulator [Bacteroidetes bacterium]|nr:response regulator [Bacteroidota bacterium]